jgi:tetratricopeptide (TPR) repeat protein
VKARLFLAAAYLRRDMPQLAEKAREQYQAVLQRDPKNRVAIFGMVTLNGAKRAVESRELLMNLIQSDPKTKEAYYTLGVLDWMIAFRPIAGANGGMGPQMYHQIADPALRGSLRDQFLPKIEEGYRMLQIALDLDPGWSNAMAYMNLLLRLQAPLVDNPAESANLITRADEWVSKALAAQRERAASKQPPSGDTIDVDGPAPTAIPSMMVVPPPPPPPPPPGFRGNGDRN